MIAAIATPMVAAVATVPVIPTMVAVIALVVMGTATIVALRIGSTGETSGARHHGHGSEQHLERHESSFVSAIAAREGDYAGDTASFLTFVVGRDGVMKRHFGLKRGAPQSDGGED
ncbi:hypothetical protein DC429_16430 [Arthrobacter sp. TPD3018]|nr:hypothetical protein DC429_16430 [Arthrobacter sp. TPD3018]